MVSLRGPRRALIRPKRVIVAAVGGGIALVSGQTASANSGFSASPSTITLPNNPTSGNLVVVCVWSNGTGTLSVSDGNSNSYTATPSTPFAGSAAKIGIYYLANAPANASKTINVSDTAPFGLMTGCAAEFSGANVSPFEQEATQSFGGANTAITTPSVTTSNNGDLLIGMALGYDNITSANSPWTGITTPSTTRWMEYYIQATSGAQSVNFTQASSTFWDAMEASFKK